VSGSEEQLAGITKSRRIEIVAVIGVTCALSVSCQFSPGRETLTQLLESTADATALGRTVFRAEPREGSEEQPLTDLRATLAYWSARNSEGDPRWRGVLSPEPQDLYERLLASIEDDAEEVTLVAYRYDAVGLAPLTLVEYCDQSGEYIGRDHVPYGGRAATTETPTFIGYDDLAWREYLQLVVDVPVFAVIGAKELSFEVVKTPLNAFDSGVVGSAVCGFSPLSRPAWERASHAVEEDWRDPFAALTDRFRVRNRHGLLDDLQSLAAALPLLGPFLESRSPPHGTGEPSPTAIVFVSTVELVGFSGGVQRFISTSRILRASGVSVNRLVGVAGPYSGVSCASKTRILLGDEPLADPVLLAAHAVNVIFFLFPSNVQAHRVEAAGGHYTPSFPQALTRAPRWGYAEGLNRFLAAAERSR